MKRLGLAILFGCLLLLPLAGGLLGYAGGREYCFAQLNGGQIYDEASYIPPDILDGSAYGKVGRIWGSAIAFLLGAGIVAWRVRDRS